MKIEASNPEEYINQLPEDRQEAVKRLRKTVKDNLPAGFEETMTYGMISYVIPLSTYPAGYHANPKLPITFISIASQKNFVAVYHMGIYSSPAILAWFQEEYPKHTEAKLDMGKGCIRFKKVASIPYELIAELCRRITLQEYLGTYESERSKSTKK